MSDQNKPCPFCGSTDVDLDDCAEDVMVVCDDCQANGPPTCIGCRDEEETIHLDFEAWELWNKRVLTS